MKNTISILMILIFCLILNTHLYSDFSIITDVVKIKSINKQMALVYSFKGEPRNVLRKIDPFWEYIGKAQLRCDGFPFAVFYDDPSRVSSENCRNELCMYLFTKGNEVLTPKKDNDFEIKELPAMTVATIAFKTEFEKLTYEQAKKYVEKICMWLKQNDYSCDSQYSFIRVLMIHNPDLINDDRWVEIQLPIIEK